MDRLSGRRRLFDILFKGLPVGCFLVNERLEIIAFNKAAETLTGWKEEDVVGKPCSQVLRSSLCQQFCPIRESAHTKKSYIAREAVIRDRFGQEVPICFSSSTVFDEQGDFEAGIEVFRDRSGDERLQTLRNHIISIFAHDIKTPCSVTGALINRILAGKAGPVTEKQREYLEVILKENQQVELLINNLLELLHIERGAHPPSKTPVDMGEFIKEVVQEMMPKAEASQIRIVFDIDKRLNRPVMLDRVQIKRVIQNLIDNAIKYSRTGSLIKVKVQVQDNWLIIKVEDQGIGIPRDDLPHIFEYFYRARNSRQKAEGTGLGLASARAIVEASGGRIWAKSKEGMGTTFFIRLPIEENS